MDWVSEEIWPQFLNIIAWLTSCYHGVKSRMTQVHLLRRIGCAQDIFIDTIKQKHQAWTGPKG